MAMALAFLGDFPRRESEWYGARSARAVAALAYRAVRLGPRLRTLVRGRRAGAGIDSRRLLGLHTSERLRVSAVVLEKGRAAAYAGSVLAIGGVLLCAALPDRREGGNGRANEDKGRAPS